LKEIAQKVGGRTLLGSKDFKADLAEALSNPNTRFTVSIEGLDGASTYLKVLTAVQRGLNPRAASPTNFELAQLYQSGRLGAVTFVNRFGEGEVLENPFK
jgi:hypothetical protein